LYLPDLDGVQDVPPELLEEDEITAFEDTCDVEIPDIPDVPAAFRCPEGMTAEAVKAWERTVLTLRECDALREDVGLSKVFHSPEEASKKFWDIFEKLDVDPSKALLFVLAGIYRIDHG
jgi:hypothetical protein